VPIDTTVTAPVTDVPPPDVPPDPEEPPPVITTGRAVTITIGGQHHQFAQEGGADLGDYVGPHFTQHCIMATNSALPALSVMFRPDADGKREEVVFELGAIWPTEPAANLGAYTATISKDGATLATVSVPQHFWFSRWRWCSAPRPVIAEVSDLVAGGLVPRFDLTAGGNLTPPSLPVTYVGPMDLAGITPYMPQTGNRYDIGIVTEWQADYLCTCSAASLTSTLAQLEGSGTLPWHYRDETTGAPLDTAVYLRASSFNQWESDPYIPWSVGNTGIELDTSHEPDLAFVPFILTGDPYAIEEMQFAVTYNVIKQNPAYRNSYNMTGALRAHAWALRTMANAARCTPDNVPKWLLPRAYFRTLLDGNRDYVAGTYAASLANPFRGMCVMEDGQGAPAETYIPADCAGAPWWEDYESAVQGHVIQMGFTDWLPNFQWQIQNLVERTNGTSGWKRGAAFPYKIALRADASSPYATDWANAWHINCGTGNCVEDTSNDHLPAGDLTYPSLGLAALAIAAELGIAGAAACHEWLQGEVHANVASNVTIGARWCVV
jgi:hypothetical protein